MSRNVILKKQWFSQRAVIFALLFPMLLLPMLHLHPAHDHISDASEVHLHPAAVHADFFPEATHGHEHPLERDQRDLDLGFSVDPTHAVLSQIDFCSLHVAQSLQSSLVFKKQTLALAQDGSDPSVYDPFQQETLLEQEAPLLQSIRFSPLALRAPPYFA